MSDASTVSVAEQVLELAHKVGVEYIFANLGSDHPAFIEAFARLEARGTDRAQVIVCPHEMTALSAAHGYAMITRKPQIVLVHVDVGTANLGGSVHNVSRGRIPAVIVAGLSPVTLNGEVTGSRTEFIHFLQDTPHQDDIVRPYVKWSHELRAPESARSVFLRGFQLAATPPEGPVYITGAREVWSAAAAAAAESGDALRPAQMGGITDEAARAIARAIEESRRPLAIASYLGRQTAAVALLAEVSDRAGVGVCEALPQTVNFPGTHPHHLGYRMGKYVDEADLILLLDVDVPWIPMQTRPAPNARVFHIDCDPLKHLFGNWHYPAEAVFQADTLSALRQIIAYLEPSPPGRAERIAWIRSKATSMAPPEGATGITQHALARAVSELINERTVVILESPAGTMPALEAIRPNRPGSFFLSGGSALGWGINAAIGAKLADPASEVIALVGDGSFVFGVPASAYWVAKTYHTPFLTVIARNGGWFSPKYSTGLVYPGGEAEKRDRFWVTMTSGSRLAEIASAAGGAAAFRVESAEALPATLREAMAAVRAGQNAVVDVAVEPISTQELG